MKDILSISKKFYKTEKERLEKLKKDELFIKYFTEKLNDYILSLYNIGIKIHVFHFEDKTIHVGLFLCCGNYNKEVPTNKRTETEEHLTALGFKNIIWED